MSDLSPYYNVPEGFKPPKKWYGYDDVLYHLVGVNVCPHTKLQIVTYRCWYKYKRRWKYLAEPLWLLHGSVFYYNCQQKGWNRAK